MKLKEHLPHFWEEHKKAIALASTARACLKKRPRGVFTYVGMKYDDGRKDLQKSLKQHFIDNVSIFNQAVFDNGKKCKSLNKDIFDLTLTPDLIYLDPDTPEAIGAFKTPTLRNIALTAPYMHDGRFEYLKEVIGHYTDGIAALPNLGKELTSGVSLSPSEQKDLTAFLFTLNDSSFCFDPRFGFFRSN